MSTRAARMARARVRTKNATSVSAQQNSLHGIGARLRALEVLRALRRVGARDPTVENANARLWRQSGALLR